MAEFSLAAPVLGAIVTAAVATLPRVRPIIRDLLDGRYRKAQVHLTITDGDRKLEIAAQGMSPAQLQALLVEALEREGVDAVVDRPEAPEKVNDGDA